MTEATPRPWSIIQIGSSAGISARIYAIEGEKDIAHVPMEWNGRTNGADAALIVRCVNNYDEALALLRDASAALGRLCPTMSPGVATAAILLHGLRSKSDIDAFLAKENSNG